MKQLKALFAPPRDDAGLARSVQQANRVLEQTKREAEEARRQHREASKRLDRAVSDSVQIAQEALREIRHDG